MITEDYVSFEIAKLLKEKGFDEKCIGFYTCTEKPYFMEASYRNNWTYEKHGSINAPTHQMTKKWLNEAHNLHIAIKPYITEEGVMYLFEIYKLEAEKFTLIKTKTGFEKSELANEAAIKYCLENLI